MTVTDDGTGPRLCVGGSTWGGDAPDPLVCDDAAVAGRDWDRHGGEHAEEEGVRTGLYQLVGTFDGSSFSTEEAAQPVG